MNSIALKVGSVCVALLAAIAIAQHAHGIIIVNTLEIESSAGVENQLAMVGFNPQRDPPGLLINSTDPTHPIYTWSRSDDHYGITLGIGHGAAGVTFETPQAFPDFQGNYMLSYALSNGYPGGLEFFDVFLDIRVDGGSINNASWFMFNPQPDPPGITDIGFGFDVLGTRARGGTSVSIGMQIVNRNTGDVGRFTLLPAPGSLAMLLVAGGLTRRQRRMS
jgi:hypothetical protein